MAALRWLWSGLTSSSYCYSLKCWADPSDPAPCPSSGLWCQHLLGRPGILYGELAD
jgi:hypothetical protein